MAGKKDLAKIIQANPGCFAVVDNDCWTLYKQDPESNPHEDETETDDGFKKWEKWDKANTLASDGEVKSLGDGGYGSGNCYGGDILQALAAIVGVTVTSV
jgi:hypothetical protein